MRGPLRGTIIALALVACRAAAADTYFVAPGGHDGWPGTDSRPWTTIQHAAETLGPGDTGAWSSTAPRDHREAPSAQFAQ